MEQSKIILIENHTVLRETMSELSRLEQFKVRAFGDGGAALGEAGREQPDTIRANLEMPPIDGPTVLEGAKADEK